MNYIKNLLLLLGYLALIFCDCGSNCSNKDLKCNLKKDSECIGDCQLTPPIPGKCTNKSFGCEKKLKNECQNSSLECTYLEEQQLCRNKTDLSCKKMNELQCSSSGYCNSQLSCQNTTNDYCSTLGDKECQSSPYCQYEIPQDKFKCIENESFCSNLNISQGECEQNSTFCSKILTREGRCDFNKRQLAVNYCQKITNYDECAQLQQCKIIGTRDSFTCEINYRVNCLLLTQDECKKTSGVCYYYEPRYECKAKQGSCTQFNTDEKCQQQQEKCQSSQIDYTCKQKTNDYGCSQYQPNECPTKNQCQLKFVSCSDKQKDYECSGYDSRECGNYFPYCETYNKPSICSDKVSQQGCGSYSNDNDCLNDQYCSWVPPVPSNCKNAQECSTKNENECKQSASACLFSLKECEIQSSSIQMLQALLFLFVILQLLI